MSDPITAKGNDSQFKPHDEGQFVGVCVDTIDLGDKVEQFAGEAPKLVHKCAIVFRTGARNESTGEYIDIAREFSVSMGEKANLRKFLEQWRGKPYTQPEVDAGVPLHKLTGQPGLLTISHKQSAKGNTYGTITACVGVPKQMRDGIGTYADYKRAEYWEKTKKDYRDAADKLRGDQTHRDDDFDNAPPDDTDSLPF